MRRSLLLALVVACASTQHPTPPPPPAFPQFAPFRLPHTFEPTRYRARLAFLPWRFSGHIEIDGTLSEPSELLWLHGVDLDVHTATAVRDATRIPLAASPPRDDQTIALVARTPLPAGPWTLELDYSGPIRDHEPKPIEMFGYQGAPLYHALGVFRRGDFLFTQAEPIYARRIFPCIDEPDRKVPWQLTLDVPTGDIAASNTPIARESPLDATHKRVEFAPTLPLPSYLIAFAVGPFHALGSGRARVLVRPGTQTRAIDVDGMLAKLEAYTDQPYPYPKLDLVAVPKLGVGGMENPGLITIDELHVAEPWLTGLVAHELAHQWFGDLVTPRWWDDIWLNESFARWMANKVSDDPNAPGSLAQDDPVRTPAGDLDQLAIDKFAPEQRIAKGAAVLEAIEAQVGEDAFRRVVRRYLARYAHGTATTADFAAELGAATDHAVDAAFAGLMEHRAPALEAHLECTSLVLARELPWPTPICVAYDRDGQRDQTCVAVTPATRQIELPARACPAWALPVPRRRSLYVTIWSPLLPGLVEHGWPQLTAVEQARIYSQLRGDADKLRVIAKLSVVDVSEVPTLSMWLRYLPDDLRPAFARWLQEHFPGAATTALADRTKPAWPAAVLLASAGEPRLAAEATRIASDFLQHPDEGGLHYMAAIAASGDPAFARRLVAAALAESDAARRYELLEVFFATDIDPALAAQLTTSERRLLLQRACTSAARAELAKVASEPAQLVYVDQCLAEKQRLEPAFRAWLEPIKAKLRK